MLLKHPFNIDKHKSLSLAEKVRKYESRLGILKVCVYEERQNNEFNLHQTLDLIL